MTAGSRYFTHKSGHFPSHLSYVEATDDGRFLQHLDDDTTVAVQASQGSRNRNMLPTCLGYVAKGQWVELQPDELDGRPTWVAPATADTPANAENAW